MSTPDELSDAFDAVAGRRPRAGLPAPLLAFAARVVEAGRRAEALEPCPRRALARAEALFAPRKASAAVALLRLVADSWRALPAAARGGNDRRFLRFGSSAGNLDLEISPTSRGGYALRGLLDVDVANPSVEVVSKGKRSKRLAVGSSGVFSAEVGADDLPLTVTVLSAGSALLRTGRIPPR